MGETKRFIIIFSSNKYQLTALLYYVPNPFINYCIENKQFFGVSRHYVAHSTIC